MRASKAPLAVRQNSLSILETIDRLGQLGFALRYDYDDINRIGDHICYISDLSKVKSHFPDWSLKYDLNKIILEIVDRRLSAART